MKKEIKRLREILENIWSKETAYPLSLKKGFQTKSRGQCYVTSLLVKKLLGGKVLEGKVKGERHYWNKIDGREIDLTSDQYGGDGFNPIVSGKEVKRLNWNNKRFLILLKKYREAIRNLDEDRRNADDHNL